VTALPGSFADLEPFVERWALPTEQERWRARSQSSIEELRGLYAAVLPRIQDIYAHVDQHPLDDLPVDAQTLLYLALSFVMASFPVEVWDSPRIPDVDQVSLDRVAEPRY
jgi:hypothetical protein